MSDGLWSVGDAAQLVNLAEARLRYWAQTGFVGPSVRQKGRFYYTFQDLISLKTAVCLVDRGLSIQRVRKNLEALKRRLPEVDRPLAQLRICSDGDELVVVDEEQAFVPASGQLVMSFAIRQLTQRLAEIAPLPAAPVPPVPSVATDASMETAYACFRAGVAALDAADDVRAERLFQRALVLDTALAAAWTNLGTIHERRGERGAAREAYERALALDPDQAEARFDLANLLADVGELELAIAEYRRVLLGGGELPDVHFNLGLALLRGGRGAEARVAFGRYLELDGDSEWAVRARELVATDC
jgi:tetratricopeptide (TPR) repeat protein